MVGAEQEVKAVVSRDRVLASARNLLKRIVRDYGRERVNKVHGDAAARHYVVSVGFSDEVGHGLGPTLEFYTLVCSKLRMAGLGLWRGDSLDPALTESKQELSSGGSPPRVGCGSGAGAGAGAGTEASAEASGTTRADADVLSPAVEVEVDAPDGLFPAIIPPGEPAWCGCTCIGHRPRPGTNGAAVCHLTVARPPRCRLTCLPVRHRHVTGAA